MDLKKSNTNIMSRTILNPTTGRQISKGSKVYNDLIKYRYMYDTETNAMIKFKQDKHLLDTEVPKSLHMPVGPIPYQTFKEKIIKNIDKLTEHLWKNREVADWILNATPEVPKALPHKIKELIELSEKTVYHITNEEYWVINIPHSECRQCIEDLLRKERQTHGREKYGKHLQMYFNNDIEYLEDIGETLLNTYKKENNGFKLHFSFGYVTEKLNEEGVYEANLFKPGRPHFHENPKIIKNKTDMRNVIEKLNAEKIIHKLSERFKDSKTKLVGIYSMAVKVIRLDFLIGSNKIKLPQYINKSPSINALADCDTNMCFWGCLALAEGCRSDCYITKAKELFKTFYGKPWDKNYNGFNLQDLDKYEKLNQKYAINIVNYVQDTKGKGIEYVRKSQENETRKPIYLNLYLDHFSYITDIEKLTNLYLCNRCAKTFRDNYNLRDHLDTCTLEQKDSFVKYPQIYEKKRNDIVELCDWFDLPDVSFSYDYLITFDFESILQNIEEPSLEDKLNKLDKLDKLVYVTKHIPISVSVATNVPGFSATGHFIISKEPTEIVQLMFEYFDQIVATATPLMITKMAPLINKVPPIIMKVKRKSG